MSSSDSEVDRHYKRSHRHHKKKKHLKKKRRSYGMDKNGSTNSIGKTNEGLVAEMRAHQTRPQGTKEEVVDIIKKLSNLKLDDPSYPAVYYQALQYDKSGAVEKCFPTPQSKRQSQRSIPVSNSPQFQNYQGRNGRTFEAQQPRPIGCYGCGITGHSLNDCQEMKEKLLRGEVRFKPGTNRYTWPNGGIIRRQPGEGIAQAIDRIAEQKSIQAAQSLLITMPNWNRAFLANQPLVVGSDSDSEDEEGMSSDEWENDYWRNEQEGFNGYVSDDEDRSDEEVDDYEEEVDRTFYEISDSEDDENGQVFEVSHQPVTNDKNSRNARLQAAREANQRPKRITKPPKQADGSNVDWRKNLGKVNPRDQNGKNFQKPPNTQPEVVSPSRNPIPDRNTAIPSKVVPDTVPNVISNPNFQPKKIL